MIEGTVIGFDFGERRIGVAVGETSTGIASPLGAIDEPANEPRFRAIAELVREWQPAGFVVGRPRHDDGSEHTVAKLAEKFARRLEARFALPVAFIDETLTSAAAAQNLRGTRTRASRPSDLDAMAATLILQSFLDEMPRVEAREP
ncbi:MAG: Holliday junction resolvase RuvX [Usitatibacter sp.]